MSGQLDAWWCGVAVYQGSETSVGWQTKVTHRHESRRDHIGSEAGVVAEGG